MTDKEDELTWLRVENAKFIRHNPAAGQLIRQFRDIYVVKLLEHLVGDDLLDLQIAHEHLIATHVGNIEGMQRKAQLEASAADIASINGRGFPIHQGRTTVGGPKR